MDYGTLCSHYLENRKLITAILYSLVIKRFSEEQPKRELTKNEQDSIWYEIYEKLCRGESEAEVEEYCKTVPLAEEKPIHRPIRNGY